MSYELGFLGAGNMAEAIARAAINSGIVPASSIIASDPADARRDVFKSLGVNVVQTNAEVIKQAKTILLAVKPQQTDQVAVDLAKFGRADQVLISIMAGISSKKLCEAIANAGGAPENCISRIVRVMPNTPLMANAGMAGVALGEQATKGDDDLAVRLFSAAGKAVRVTEDEIDAIKAVSGSGPAYVFYLAEAMERAAEELGLGKHAHTLVTQTILGAAKLLDQSQDTPAELRKKVTSPGGTTQAAVEYLEGHEAAQILVDAVKAAEARSRELGA